MLKTTPKATLRVQLILHTRTRDLMSRNVMVIPARAEKAIDVR